MYGLHQIDYERLLQKQNYRCAICKRLPSDDRQLCVDHDHSSKMIRGMLCSKCNSLLGFAGDEPRILAAAIVYLEEHGIRYLSGHWEENE